MLWEGFFEPQNMTDSDSSLYNWVKATTEWIEDVQVPSIGSEVELYSQQNDSNAEELEHVPIQSVSVCANQAQSPLRIEPKEEWTKEPYSYKTLYMRHVADLHLEKPLPNMRSENAKCWLEFKATSAYEPLPDYSAGDESDDKDSIKKKTPAGSIVEVQLIQKNRNMKDFTPHKREKRLKTKFKSHYKKLYSPLGRCFECKLCGRAVKEVNRLRHLKRCLEARKKHQSELAEELLTSLLNDYF